MAILPQPLLHGSYTIVHLASLIQPYREEVLYVVDEILYVEPSIESFLKAFKKHNIKLRLRRSSYDDRNKHWMFVDDSGHFNEWWFFRKDVVDTLLISKL